MELFTQTMMKIVVLAYRQNWYFILKQYSAHWTRRDQADAFTCFPLSYNDVYSNLRGSLYVTTDNSAAANTAAASVLSQKDKTAILTPGTCLVTSC
jgi:hypothetical protein